jgi:hypothetical protein
MPYMKLKSSYLCIAYAMLIKAHIPDNYSDPTVWSTLDFPGYKKNDVVEFFNRLILERVLVRSLAARGPNSGSRLINPKRLLNICIEGFTDNVLKRYYYVSKLSYDNIIKNLTALNIKFFIGGMQGVRAALREVRDNRLTILIPEREWFTGYKQQELQLKLGINKVHHGGDIEIVLPRYHRFLNKLDEIDNPGSHVTPDFYTYLSMKSSKDPMAQQQAKHMENILRGEHGSFLNWQT